MEFRDSRVPRTDTSNILDSITRKLCLALASSPDFNGNWARILVNLMYLLATGESEQTRRMFTKNRHEFFASGTEDFRRRTRPSHAKERKITAATATALRSGA